MGAATEAVLDAEEERALRRCLGRTMTPPAPETLARIDAGPLHEADALRPSEVDRLLDPTPLPVETGWRTCEDGIAYVAVRTPMPKVSAEMVDWWFDWYPRDPLRYKVWYPGAHLDVAYEAPRRPGEKAHWGAVHHLVEDVGLGRQRVRIELLPPSAVGFGTDALDDPNVGTVVCGWTGDDGRRLTVGPLVHVFLEDPPGLVLRSRFWIGAGLRPHILGPIADAIGVLTDRGWVRRSALPAGLAPALARHCAAEFSNLAELLPDLYRRFGPDA